MRVLDLFSGIGGFSLGLERAGMTTVAFCEIEPFCRAVLRKHWPEVPIYEDIRTLSADVLERDGIAVDAICGGFPCQDLSHAGKRAGLEGERSGLWGEYRRLIGELRPRFVIVENVPGLLSLGMGTVLGDISALGYNAVWDCVPASAVGAPHRRDRVWIVAFAPGARLQERDRTGASAAGQPLSEPERGSGLQHDVADTDNARLERRQRASLSERAGERVAGASGASIRNPSSEGLSDGTERAMGQSRAQPEPKWSDWWVVEPDVGRVANGVPARVHRLKALGNAVVPQVVEIIGRAIMQAEAA
jgi:DNA (cytosine-5)-methyltransferase 1